MAFKQKCPSCENPVLIKDTSLVGKKIVCPKCKDTFAIAAPVETAASAGKKVEGSAEKIPALKRKKAVVRDDDDAEPGDDSSSDKGNKKLIIGASVGAGILALGVMIFALSGTPEPVPPSGSPGTKGVAASGATGSGDGKTGSEVAGKPPASTAPETNLLPNNAEGVLSVDIARFRNTPLAAALLGSDGDAEFEKRMGFRFSEMTNAWISSNYTQGWVFAVIKSGKALNADMLRAAMEVDGSRRFGTGNHELLPIRSNELIDLIGAGITGAMDESGLPVLKYPADRHFGMHLYNANTLIVADMAPLELFLKADRLPKSLTQVAATAAPVAPTGTSMPPGMPGMMPGSPGVPSPGGPTPAMPKSPSPGGPTPAMPGSPPATTAVPGSTPATVFSTDSRFLTIDPSLKSMIGYLEADTSPILTLATRLPNFGTNLSNLILLAKISGAAFPINVDKMPKSPIVGMTFSALRQDKGVGTFAIESESDGGFVAVNEALKIALTPMAETLTRYFGMPIAPILTDAPATNPNNPNGTGMPGSIPPGGTYPGGMPPGGMYPGGSPMPTPGMPIGPAGAKSFRPSERTESPVQYQSPLPPVGPGGGSPSPSAPGFPGSRPAGIPGMPGSPSMPGTPGSTGQPGATVPLPPSWVKLSTSDRIVAVGFEFDWKLNYPERVSYPVRSFVEAQKGRAIIASRRNTWYNLSGAIKKLEAAPTFPRGTMDRKLDTTRMGRPWNPDQRVSWMVELLPHMGRGLQYARIQKDQGWNSEDNLTVGESLIPEFINPNTPSSSWRVKASGLKDRELAVTHYVGLSGIGMDSVEDYPGLDPKKLGIFGYDRTVKVEDVRNGDGLSNTILMIQVPASPARAWIRGGGATVQGVQPTNSLRPFLSPQAGGKAGTHVLMADGSVRFLPANLPDALFQGMVTYAGGEKLDKLDELAPLQEIPGRKTELKGGAAPELLNPKR